MNRRDLLVSTVGILALQELSHSQPTPASRSRDFVFADFESGTYDGWTLTGSCWTQTPASGDTSKGQITGFQGTRFLSTLHPRLLAAATGKAVSKVFTIQRPYINFLIGGGKFAGETGLNLVVNEKVVRSATGNDRQELERRTWDVLSLVGQKAHFEVVDTCESQENGYIMVDDIRFGSHLPPTQASYHIGTQFARRVSATLTTTVISPKTTDGELRVYAPVPPDLPTQKVVECTIRCREHPAFVSSRTADLKNTAQEYLCLHIPVKGDTLRPQCTVDVKYVVDLFKADIVDGPAVSPLVASSSWAEDYRREFLSETIQADIANSEFREWLRDANLIKADSEGNLHFARRVFQYISQSGTTGPFVPIEKRKASILCKNLTGDCGALSILYISVLRAYGVPATVTPGRWALTEEPHYGQFYVTCGIIEPGVGVIPIDQFRGIDAKTKNIDPDRSFGTTEGNYIVFNVCPELNPEVGLVVPIHHYMVWARSGITPFVPRFEDHWKVEKLK